MQILFLFSQGKLVLVTRQLFNLPGHKKWCHNFLRFKTQPSMYIETVDIYIVHLKIY